MLRWRLLLGTTFIAALVGLCWLDAAAAIPGTWLFPLAVAVSLAGSGEVLWLASARGLQPLAWVVYLGTVLIVCANWLPRLDGVPDLGPLGWPAAALAIGMILAFVGEMRRYTEPGQVTERLAVAVLALCYVGVLMSFVIQLRMLHDGAWGIPALAALILVVKMGDTGAYTFGRLFGKHRMTPVLSPGKTWEGAAGGLACACLGSWLAFHVIFPAPAESDVVVHDTYTGLQGAFVTISGQAARGTGVRWGWIAFGLLVGMAGVLGDLAESLLKRDLGRKDSSPWMPGFGGVLDLLDSILLAAPVAWLCFVCGLVGFK